MAEFNRIGVKITMADGVSAVLATLGREALGLDKRLDLARHNIGKLTSAILGLGGLTLGTPLLRSFARLAEEGGKIVDQFARMQAIGEGAAPPAANMQVAFRAAATVYGATSADAARAILGNSAEPRIMAPTAPEFTTVLRGQNPGMIKRQADAAMIFWPKGIDIQSAFINRKTGLVDPKKVADAFHMMEAASLLTNGLLTGQAFYQFTRMAGPAVSLAQLREYLEQRTDLILGLGRAGGRGMQMAFTKLLGGNLTKAQAQELVAGGAAKQGDIRKKFDHYTLRHGALVSDTDLATMGINDWFQYDLLPLSQKIEHGKGMTGLVSALKKSGATGETTADLVSSIANTRAMPITADPAFAFLLMNQAQVNRFKNQIDNGLKTHTTGVLESKSSTMNGQSLEGALKERMEEIGGPVEQLTVPLFQDLASMQKMLTGIVGAHHEAVTVLVGAMGTIGAMLTASRDLRVGLSVPRTMKGVLPALGGARGGVAAGTETAGGLALLSTGLPELAAALVGIGAMMSAFKRPLLTWVDAHILGMTLTQPAHKEEVLRKTKEKRRNEFIRAIEDVFPWKRDLSWDAHYSGGPPAWIYDRRRTTSSPVNVHMSAPLNVTVEGSMLGTRAELWDLMGGWWDQHGRRIGQAVAAEIEHQQRHLKRRTFLDEGGPLSGYMP